MARSTSLVLRLVLLFLPITAGCGGASSGEGVAAIRFDPCAPLVLAIDAGLSTDQRGGVAAASAAWNAAAGARLSVDATGALPVHFQAAAAPSHGFFDPARGEIFINDDLIARPLAVTIAHELGHAFGLVHVTDRPSVMNVGNLDVEPNAGDVAALSSLWGACDVTDAGRTD